MTPLESILEHNTPPQSTPNLGPSLTLDQLETLGKPKVIISGAGLAGLTLGILLKKADIPFIIFEKVRGFKPLGKLLPILELNKKTFLSKELTMHTLLKNRLGYRAWQCSRSTLPTARDL